MRGVLRGAAGAADVAAADAWMQAQRIANPPRLAALLFPALRDG